MSAPRMIPRLVSSLIWSPPRRASSAILLPPCQVQTVACRRGRRVTPNDLPPPFVEDPDVGQQHAVLDRAAEVGQPPARMDRADHHVVEDGRIVLIERDIVHLTVLD